MGLPFRGRQSPARRREGLQFRRRFDPGDCGYGPILLASLQARADAMNAPFEYPATYTRPPAENPTVCPFENVAVFA
jgi:hypothetical protein